MAEVKLKFTEEEEKAVFEGGQKSLLPDGWYQVEIVSNPEIRKGKESGKPYILWSTTVCDGEHGGTLVEIRTTLDKGDDPKKSKRFLFHQMMKSLDVKKENNAYHLQVNDSGSELNGLVGKRVYVKVETRENSYNNRVYKKNEVKHANKTPNYWNEKKIGAQLHPDGEFTMKESKDHVGF